MKQQTKMHSGLCLQRENDYHYSLCLSFVLPKVQRNKRGCFQFHSLANAAYPSIKQQTFHFSSCRFSIFKHRLLSEVTVQYNARFSSPWRGKVFLLFYSSWSSSSPSTCHSCWWTSYLETASSLRVRITNISKDTTGSVGADSKWRKSAIKYQLSPGFSASLFFCSAVAVLAGTSWSFIATTQLITNGFCCRTSQTLLKERFKHVDVVTGETMMCKICCLWIISVHKHATLTLYSNIMVVTDPAVTGCCCSTLHCRTLLLLQHFEFFDLIKM